MAWSYRADRADEVYTDTGGPAIVTGGEQQPDAPNPESLGDKKLRDKNKDKKPVEGIFTQFQERPGQDVPRVIEGEGDTAKDKEIVKATKAEDERKKKGEEVDPSFVNAERARIKAEEQEKMRQDELEKEREKIRKEVQGELKKSEKKEAAPAHK